MRSYRTFPPLPDESGGLNLYGTFPEVTLAGRYPAHCPVEPGLSSNAAKALAIALDTHKSITYAIIAPLLFCVKPNQTKPNRGKSDKMIQSAA